MVFAKVGLGVATGRAPTLGLRAAAAAAAAVAAGAGERPATGFVPTADEVEAAGEALPVLAAAPPPA